MINKNFNTIIGKRIRTARELKQWTQDELAKKMEVSAPCISSWESGRTAPNFEAIMKLQNLLNVPLTSVDAATYSDFVTSMTDGSDQVEVHYDIVSPEAPKKTEFVVNLGMDLTKDEKEMIEAYRKASTSAKMQAYQILIKGAF